MYVVDLNLSRLNVLFEVMNLQHNMFCPMREFLRSCHRDAKLVIFPNLAVKFGGFIIRGKTSLISFMMARRGIASLRAVKRAMYSPFSGA